MDPRKVFVFSDESYYTNADGVDVDHNYRALGFVIIDGSENLKKHLGIVNALLPKGKKEECKWYDCTTAAKARDYKIFLDSIREALDDNIKIMSICFNDEHVKHKAPFEIDYIYYQVLKRISSFYPDGESVQLNCIHDHGGPKLKKAESFLNTHLKKITHRELLYTQEELELIGLDEYAAYGDMYEEDSTKKFTFNKIDREKSHKNPLVQLADFFAGMHAFSWRYHAFESSSKKFKNEVIQHVRESFGTMPVNGLQTGQKHNPNFWRWEIQKR
ncbi:MAG: DUF3800 domain-containing protein [Simkaniaceae bacterium]|nr:DUF3800 domain-containing protein [Simkaniaceae bacterium]